MRDTAANDFIDMSTLRRRNARIRRVSLSMSMRLSCMVQILLLLTLYLHKARGRQIGLTFILSQLSKLVQLLLNGSSLSVEPGTMSRGSKNQTLTVQALPILQFCSTQLQSSIEQHVVSLQSRRGFKSQVIARALSSVHPAANPPLF